MTSRGAGSKQRYNEREGEGLQKRREEMEKESGKVGVGEVAG